MIGGPDRGHEAVMAQAGPDLSCDGEPNRDSTVRTKMPDPSDRLRALVEAHFDFIWRSLRRLGLSGADADDGAQQVFIVASRRLEDIQLGRERAFLFGTAVRVASDVRRAARRRPEVVGVELEPTDIAPGPQVLTERLRARQALDEILEGLPIEVRTVFVLFELEELTAVEIAELAGIPVGTVSSRLRRGRELFRAAVKRRQARDAFPGGDR